MIALQTKNQHLMWRAGFGPSSAQLQSLDLISTSELYTALKKATSGKVSFIDVADDYLKGFFMGAGEIGRQEKRIRQSTEDRKKIREQNRDDIRSLNLAWLDEMVHSEGQLREKMAFFWHGHFASRNINIFYQQQLLDIIRQNALGNFRTLLHEVSRSAAILNFLNAQQNRKDHPNENFAREVMELFTLGRGNYSEKDVKEAARAFTGWGASAKGEFVFRKFQHDKGNKTVFGNRGNFEGEDILDMILENPKTANFICRKIYRFFVNENIDESKVTWLSERFYSSGYDIASLLDDIFLSEWFYDKKNIGTKIKSPVELLAGIRRMLPMEIEQPESLLILQRLMGQLLFYPPNVSGWPYGNAWIDSSTLMLRLRIPGLFSEREALDAQPKDDDDQMMGTTVDMKRMGRAGRPVMAIIEWNDVVNALGRNTPEKTLAAITTSLLQVQPHVPLGMLRNEMNHGKSQSIKQAVLQVMSLPEYQLC